jgi:hypothetical protein
MLAEMFCPQNTQRVINRKNFIALGKRTEYGMLSTDKPWYRFVKVLCHGIVQPGY